MGRRRISMAILFDLTPTFGDNQSYPSADQIGTAHGGSRTTPFEFRLLKASFEYLDFWWRAQGMERQRWYIISQHFDINPALFFGESLLLTKPFRIVFPTSLLDLWMKRFLLFRRSPFSFEQLKHFSDGTEPLSKSDFCCEGGICNSVCWWEILGGWKCPPPFSWEKRGLSHSSDTKGDRSLFLIWRIW